MIVSNLMGGLGNQMFQYACGRALSLRTGQDFFVDLCFLRKRPLWANYTLRSYELPVFRLEVPVAHWAQLAHFEPYDRREYWKPWVLWRKWHGVPVVRDACQEPQKDVLTLKGHNYLHGFWQSEFYFADYASEIRQDFQFRAALDPTNQRIADSILAGESVSLHLRRGDYVNLGGAAKHHGLCSLDYYRRAMVYLREHLSGLRCFVFTDDPAWAKEHLRFLDPEMVVDCNVQGNAYRDMQLMSLCRHHVVANSSFSWWGAWLAQHPTQLVVAPKRWYAQHPLDSQGLGLLPAHWVPL